MVKKEGSYHFHVDNWGLNAVTKPSTYQQSFGSTWRSQGLLDIDFAAGFWQFQMDPQSQSQEQMPFTVRHGLYKLLVMTFRLTNAPVVLQCLMQLVISGQNHTSGKDFMTAYMDDMLLFSRSLQEHLGHSCQVLDLLQSVNRRLKP